MTDRTFKNNIIFTIKFQKYCIKLNILEQINMLRESYKELRKLYNLTNFQISDTLIQFIFEVSFTIIGCMHRRKNISISVTNFCSLSEHNYYM